MSTCVPWSVLLRWRRRVTPTPQCIRDCGRYVSGEGKRCRWCAAKENAKHRKPRTRETKPRDCRWPAGPQVRKQQQLGDALS